MHVLPVVDVLGGLAVHAVRGERSNYQPVRSVLTQGADPLILGLALQRATDSPAVYLADLDAILDDKGNWDTLRSLAKHLPCELWVDAGISDAHGALQVLETGAAQVVAGTESLKSLESLRIIGEAAGWNRVLVSLDVLHGTVLSKTPELSGKPPLDCLEILAGMGCDRFILLTLDGVGAAKGPDWSLLEPARKRLPQATLIAGGGARGMEDVRQCAGLGLHGILVGTALHNGWITAGDLAGVA